MIATDTSMPKKHTDSNRNERVAAKVHTIVAEILRKDYADDPIISKVSLVGADAHGGLQFVRLFFHCPIDDIDVAKRALDIETRTIRFKMGQRIDQKYVPQIRFTYDDTLEKAERIEELLERVSEEK
jgi:ribosome-binding factor A